MDGIAERGDRGGRTVRLSLARISHELQGMPVPDAEAGETVVRTSTAESAYGTLVHVPPPLAVDGARLAYPAPPRPYGADDLAWR
jgi:hypothetical protein